MFSGCPSVRPKPEITFFHLYMGPLVHPTNRDRFAACPSVRLSVRPERFPGICRRTHGGNGRWSEIRLWSWSVDFPPFGVTLT